MLSYAGQVKTLERASRKQVGMTPLLPKPIHTWIVLPKPIRTMGHPDRVVVVQVASLRANYLCMREGSDETTQAGVRL